MRSFICIVELVQMWLNLGLVLDEITEPLLKMKNILIGIQSLSFGEMPVLFLINHRPRTSLGLKNEIEIIKC